MLLFQRAAANARDQTPAKFDFLNAILYFQYHSFNINKMPNVILLIFQSACYGFMVILKVLQMKTLANRIANDLIHQKKGFLSFPLQT